MKYDIINVIEHIGSQLLLACLFSSCYNLTGFWRQRGNLFKTVLVSISAQTPSIKGSRVDEVKFALENEDLDGQKLFIDAVQRAKSTEIPDISEMQKIGKFFMRQVNAVKYLTVSFSV